MRPGSPGFDGILTRPPVGAASGAPPSLNPYGEFMLKLALSANAAPPSPPGAVSVKVPSVKDEVPPLPPAAKDATLIAPAAPPAPITTVAATGSSMKVEQYAPEAPPLPNGVYVTVNGQSLSGWMNVDYFHVPAGQRVLVQESFSVCAAHYISIEGDLVLQDRGLSDPRTDAPDLRLTSGEEVLITGRIIGGGGRSFGGVALDDCVGQRGGNIVRVNEPAGGSVQHDELEGHALRDGHHQLLQPRPRSHD